MNWAQRRYFAHAKYLAVCARWKRFRNVADIIAVRLDVKCIRNIFAIRIGQPPSSNWPPPLQLNARTATQSYSTNPYRVRTGAPNGPKRGSACPRVRVSLAADGVRPLPPPRAVCAPFVRIELSRPRDSDTACAETIIISFRHYDVGAAAQESQRAR